MQNLRSFSFGLILCFILTMVARYLSQLPLISIIGAMVTAILLGILVRAIRERQVIFGQSGINFTAKYLLRAGIILMGVRLNMSDIIAAGWQTIVLDIAVIVFAITVIQTLGRKFQVETKLATLIGVGTGVCGAAAIGAVAPIIKAKNEVTAISVTIIALLGTLFTIVYTLILPLLGLSPYQYGIFSGSTLHELAHVIAASQVYGAESSDIAIIVKLGRVALLVPVALILGWLYAKREQKELTIRHLPIPWFLFGFLATAVLNTYHVIPLEMVTFLTSTSMILLTMAMAALGLNVRLTDFKRVGHKPILIGLIGSILLSFLGRTLITLLNL